MKTALFIIIPIVALILWVIWKYFVHFVRESYKVGDEIDFYEGNKVINGYIRHIDIAGNLIVADEYGVKHIVKRSQIKIY